MYLVRIFVENILLSSSLLFSIQNIYHLSRQKLSFMISFCDGDKYNDNYFYSLQEQYYYWDRKILFIRKTSFFSIGLGNFSPYFGIFLAVVSFLSLSLGLSSGHTEFLLWSVKEKKSDLCPPQSQLLFPTYKTSAPNWVPLYPPVSQLLYLTYQTPARNQFILSSAQS